ncbi:hypothetical protein GCM10007160_02330 [Litchfieldella qijiaojingensis]|uniref:Uncharacterized protein n=1 Tax=Litchfieldella qijiaojingensis TaxID=980347 RepID=A0ABQ2YB49_9GAMM|nr:hypothetical protein [Halomonas qijiaojingensis]GGX78598.1 hypothetical protein GCM10007160_02330 [Halomonas qijiaojingensis]
MMKMIVLILVCIVAAGIVALVLNDREQEKVAVDPKNLTPEQEEYCDMVDQWRREEMFDVEPKWRWGSPDAKGTYDQWCRER